MDLSVVIPIFNEEENIKNLVEEISISLKHLSFEVIVVDDKSSDNSLNVLKDLKSNFEFLRVVLHKNNYGQSSAIRTGILSAKSKWIATVDGDGQNDPVDIPKLYNSLIEMNKLNENVLIAGNRINRKDNWLKRFSSTNANRIRARILKDEAPDTGCGLKLFPKNFFLGLPFFDHMHRYIPALFISQGGSVISIAVNHRPRNKGESKYGFNNRFWVGISDLFGVRWLMKRSKIIISEEIK